MTTPDTVAVDTSVAIPLLVSTHAAHEGVAEWARGRRLALCGHAVIETYSVLTRLPGDVRLAPVDAIRLINASFTRHDEAETDLVDRFAAVGVSGGAVYDGLVAAAARQRSLPIASRDARARSTYEALGVTVVMVA